MQDNRGENLILASSLKNILSNRTISGLGEGEKIMLSAQYDRLIFLSSDFVSAGKIKRGLEGLGKKVEIISNSRENDDENDKNLLPFACSVMKYLSGQLDGLIFLPCSMIVKFDLESFKPHLLKKGDTINLEQFVRRLISQGYERTSFVTSAGQFAIRGEIIDIFTTSSDMPVRIELFDDLIENISIFDISTMKNVEKLDSIEIYLARLPIGKNNVTQLEGIKIVDEPKKIEDEIELLKQSYMTTSFYKESYYENFENLIENATNIFDNFQLARPDYFNEMISHRSYLTDFMALKADLEDFKNLNQAVVLFAGNEKHKENLKQFLNENNISYLDNEDDNFIKKNIYLSSEAMPYSFSFLKEGIIGIGCDSLFRHKEGFSKGKHSVFYLPKLGEYVVHSFHGIGKCVKIERMKISDAEKDYFVIEYKNGDTLFLPSEEASTLSAYVGSESEPKLSSLGGAEFSRLKSKARASIKEMAISLVEIYNERQNLKGYKFRRDDFLEQQFAETFGFQETVDQLKAIKDIDDDMESGKVMDRLICGDVGYGKTEVALRACFKCIYNGKQVCLLCPTTILSAQHYRTAKSRLEPFGVKVEVLNRFKTTGQVKDILTRLKNGEIDMIIGTHRVLGKDVEFKDLGLLVLDEEQRFGVEHKEKIKDKKRNIDVLTLSATPIPRTLNMSLSGIRDISVIETPPKDRLPIQTYVAGYSDELLKDVSLREISRGGQVFIIFNRVEFIDEFAAHVKALIPSAKIAVAHGQMHERALESIIDRLYDGEYNIFISTTLIENGIDLPSANTMIIIEADRLGLSQLYQLRGRIGRSDKLGYAYLTYVKDKKLTDEAYKRLEAIKEFSQLGSGFKIAIRDLEIRGAGNIFGKEQHGHIAKVGYDMYIKLLEEETNKIKGEKIDKKSDVKMEIALNAFISERYIEDVEERINFYTKISEISSQNQIKSICQSLEDAFGPVPKEIINLCKIAYLRNLAANFDISMIKINKSDCKVILQKNNEIIDKRLADNLGEFSARLSYTSVISINFNVDGSVESKLDKVTAFFKKAIKEEE